MVKGFDFEALPQAHGSGFKLQVGRLIPRPCTAARGPCQLACTQACMRGLRAPVPAKGCPPSLPCLCAAGVGGDGAGH